MITEKCFNARLACMIKSLNMGIPITIGNYTYVLSDTNELCTQAIKECQDGSKVPVSICILGDGLQYLFSLAASVTEDEFAIIVSNYCLNKDLKDREYLYESR